MTLNEKQMNGLKIAVARYNRNMPYTCIAGYAGTGKSTLIKFIVAVLGLNPEEDVAYVTFTGKAADVLRHKGCTNAMTAHKLLYFSTRLKNGKFVFRPKPYGEIGYKLIIVDEISMLPKDMWNLLLAHKVPVLACGDPGQLSPIKSDADNHVLDNPHIFLDEVMRQAQDSDIIKLSMDIRAGKDINYYKGADAQVISPGELTIGHLKWADQILCATNKKRKAINAQVRSAYGRNGEPVEGDKVICLSNYWDIIDTNGDCALVNGTTAFIESINIENINYNIRNLNKTVKIIRATIRTPSGEIFTNLPIDYNAVMHGIKTLTPEEEYTLYKYNKYAEEPLEVPLEFNWGYAITTHKAQGSQWDKVLVIEEGFPVEESEHKRWCYTAVTRPSSRLVLVR